MNSILKTIPAPGLALLLLAGAATAQTETQLGGKSVRRQPYFEFPQAFNQGETVQFAIEPSTHLSLIGQSVDVYITANKDAAGWAATPALVDVSGGAETVLISGVGIFANITAIDTGTLSGNAGTGLGVPYDVVVDVDQNGSLGAGDLIDGLSGNGGIYVVSDLTVAGPLAVTEAIYSGGTFLGQDTYYPTSIGGMGQLPLVVISHGNGHNYQWYDNIGMHLASYGFIVMSHQNNTGPGIETASTTTLTNTEYILANQATIQGGVLNGHIDNTRITWIGHSRGGEGVCRAFDRIFDGTYIPVNFNMASIDLISSMAPTDFLGTSSATPHAANYSLWTAGADSDVNGCANCDLCQTFHLHDRAEGTRCSISLHGVGHGDLHSGTGGAFATGPCLVGKTDANTIQRGYVLPLVKHFIEGNLPAKDYLWRQYEAFHPIGVPTAINPCIVVDLMYREGAGTKFVLDDFQTNPSTALSSSGGTVSFNVQNVTENRLDDNNTDFTHNVGDPMNGMTSANAADTSRGLVFEVDGAMPRFLTFDVPVAGQDVTNWDFFSFRSVQATRHPFTVATLADAVYNVTLRDGTGHSSSIRVSAYGGGIEEPYQRTGCGVGAGWANEWETIRMRFLDFTHGGTNLDLTDIIGIDFQFLTTTGSIVGRFGMDDIEFVKQ